MDLNLGVERSPCQPSGRTLVQQYEEAKRRVEA